MIIIGDTHFKELPVYLNAQIKFLEWLHTNYKNEHLLFLGDFYDTPTVHFDKVQDHILEIILQFPHIHIIHGNHEYNRGRGSVLRTLSRFKNIKVYFEDCTEIIEDKKTLILPFQYKEEDFRRYELITERHDIVAGHFSPPGYNRGVDEVDLQMDADNFIYGHIHIPADFINDHGRHCILGVPLVTRNGEQDCKKRIYSTTDGYIPVPTFMTIESVKYGDEPKSKDNLLNIYDAPSVESVYMKYGDFNVRREGIEFVRTQQQNTQDMKKNFSSLEDHFERYTKDKNTSKEVHDTVLSYFSRVPA